VLYFAMTSYVMLASC